MYALDCTPNERSEAVTLEDGEVHAGIPSRTRKKSLQAVYDNFFREVEPLKKLRVVVMHSGALEERIRQGFSPVELMAQFAAHGPADRSAMRVFRGLMAGHLSADRCSRNGLRPRRYVQIAFQIFPDPVFTRIPARQQVRGAIAIQIAQGKGARF